MNDLVRPAMYDAFHDIRPVGGAGRRDRAYDVVGPVCETGDTFTRDRALPPFGPGDLVAFMSAGAYGAAMASEYNTRPLVPEVLVDGDRFAVIRAAADRRGAGATDPDWCSPPPLPARGFTLAPPQRGIPPPASGPGGS